MTPARLPPHAPGMRIGLYGGSLQSRPCRATGMSACSRCRRLRLDRVWWMVTPGNPLKERGGLPPACERAGRRRRRWPGIRASTSPASRTRSARATPSRPCAYLAAALPGGALRLDHGGRQPGAASTAGAAGGAIAGADAHRGRRPAGLDPARRPARAPPRRWRRFRIDESDAALLPARRRPAWVFLHGPRSPLSSSELRQQGAKFRSGRPVEKPVPLKPPDTMLTLAAQR